MIGSTLAIPPAWYCGTPAGGSWFGVAPTIPPRWACGFWPTGLGWLHIVSDLAIWGAYMAIPGVLGFFLLRRKMPLPHVGWLFIAFIATCGIGHFIEALIFWHPLYPLSGVWKFITAVVSWLTVGAIIPLLPKALHWPDLDEVNEALQREVGERREAARQIAQVVDAAPVGMLMFDDDGLIVRTNRHLDETFGYDSGELVGMRVDVLVPERLRPRNPAHRASAFSRPPIRSAGGERELVGRRKGGSELPIDVGIRPIEMGRDTHTLATIVDITEHKRVEAELLQLNQALEQKNAEIEQFVYSVSHDLKSPIVSIRGFLGHLRKDIEAGRDDRLETFTEYIDKASRTMRRNINELLELSRAGRVEFHFHPVDTNALVERIVTELDPHDPNVVIDVQDGLPLVVGDETQLERAVQNYLANALAYGRPEVGPQHIRIGGSVVDDEARFWVRDNGPGIEQPFAAQVFDAFTRLDGSTEGTGMGLAIVKRIAERHGGRVWVDPGTGFGCTFGFAIPLTGALESRTTG